MKHRLPKELDKIEETLQKYNLQSLDNCEKICKEKGVDVESIVKGIQPICFDDAVKAYNLGCAIAFEKNEKEPESIAKNIGEGLQAFCKAGSVADERQIGSLDSRIGTPDFVYSTRELIKMRPQRPIPRR